MLQNKMALCEFRPRKVGHEYDCDKYHYVDGFQFQLSVADRSEELVYLSQSIRGSGLPQPIDQGECYSESPGSIAGGK